MPVKYFLPFLVFVLLVVFLYAGLFLNKSLLPSPLLGAEAPHFSLATVNMPEQQLDEKVFLGKVSLLNVWASWCRSCIQEHPVLMRLSEQHAVPIYGLNYKDTRREAKEWLERFGNPYLLNFFDQEGLVAIDWGVYGVPETFLIDAWGRIRYKHVGPLQSEIVKDHLLPLIEKVRTDDH